MGRIVVVYYAQYREGGAVAGQAIDPKPFRGPSQILPFPPSFPPPHTPRMLLCLLPAQQLRPRRQRICSLEQRQAACDQVSLVLDTLGQDLHRGNEGGGSVWGGGDAEDTEEGTAGTHRGPDGIWEENNM